MALCSGTPPDHLLLQTETGSGPSVWVHFCQISQNTRYAIYSGFTLTAGEWVIYDLAENLSGQSYPSSPLNTFFLNKFRSSERVCTS